jgi:hypothetical protein
MGDEEIHNEPSVAEQQPKLGISRAKAVKRCHFDRREKSFPDPSPPLGMTDLGRHLGFLASLRRSLS